ANYFASGELLPRLFTLTCAKKRTVVLSKNRRCLFCDTFRQRPSGRCRTNAARVFYAACCRMVFGLSSSESCDSPAIICHPARILAHSGLTAFAGHQRDDPPI